MKPRKSKLYNLARGKATVMNHYDHNMSKIAKALNRKFIQRTVGGQVVAVRVR